MLAMLQARPGTYIHRQTVASAMRFVTTELAELEQRIAAAGDRVLAMELEIFATLSARVVDQRDRLAVIAGAIAAIDVASSLAELAETNRYVRPRVDSSKAFEIRAGRHPVVEAMLRDRAESNFVANDCHLSGDGRRLWLLTGPNMAGKSTFLRQNALIVVLAQMGCFVPADVAHVGVVDRLFSRVGAADDLARGRSTFMVEMVETAAILNQATDRSFVILDEIGRGTATFDGLSIAWATSNTLHDVNALPRALRHALSRTDRAGGAAWPAGANATVGCTNGRATSSSCTRSCPAWPTAPTASRWRRLAGLPQPVIARASEILEHLEQDGQARAPKALIDDLPLFSASRQPATCSSATGAERHRKEACRPVPDELSPREALALLYELKGRCRTKTAR